jgi:hypothetical protein
MVIFIGLFVATLALLIKLMTESPEMNDHI